MVEREYSLFWRKLAFSRNAMIFLLESSEPRFPTTANPRYSKRSEKQDPDLNRHRRE